MRGGLGERGRQSFEVRMPGRSPPPPAAAAFRPCLHDVSGYKSKHCLNFGQFGPKKAKNRSETSRERSANDADSVALYVESGAFAMIMGTCTTAAGK